MTRTSGFATFSTVLCLLLVPRPSHADSITITNGFLDVSNNLAQVALAGSDFSLTASADIYAGIFDPVLQCQPGPCLPGTAVDMKAYWIGNDLPATVSWSGTTYNNVGSLSNDTSAFVLFSGQVLAPPLGDSGFLQTPFAFTGAFSTGTANVTLAGSGTASIWFHPDALGVGWSPAEVRYDFAADPVVTPEPATLALFASGLLFVVGMLPPRRRS